MAGHPQWVEKYYSTGFYPLISAFFRRLYGWVPFSVGDLIYFFLIAVSIGYLIRKRHWIRHHPWTFLRDCLVAFSVLHFTFYLLWGSNYFRQPLAQTLGYEVKYTTAELVGLTGRLAEQTNALQQELTGDSLQAVEFPNTRDLNLRKTLVGYQELAKDFPGLAYDTPSLKPSLFSTLLSYMGYGGYLNPFTGEAQVNHKLPVFRHSVVCGHEVGHQLGYSAENETNFIGYLVTLRNPDKYFRYSASAYGLSYCLSEIRRRDKGEYEKLLKQDKSGSPGELPGTDDFLERF